MHYLNQRDYPHIPYPYNAPEDDPTNTAATIYKCGCGICSMCMIVENMTMRRLDIRDCLDLALEVKATTPKGTYMRLLGPAAAEKYGMTCGVTSDPQALAEHLGKGGMAIAHVAQSRDRDEGLFSHGGHYIVVVAYDGEDVCILDPSYDEEKYKVPFRAEKIRVDRPFLYCAMDTLVEATQLREPHFYLFSRKKPC